MIQCRKLYNSKVELRNKDDKKSDKQQIEKK